MTSYDIDGIKTTEGTFDFPDSGMNLAWTGIGQWEDMINPCSMMVYMGAIANGGEATHPNIVKPTTFMGKQIDKITTKTTNMIDSTTAASLTEMMANNVVSHYGLRELPRPQPLRQVGYEQKSATIKSHTHGSPDFSTTTAILTLLSYWSKTADTVLMYRCCCYRDAGCSKQIAHTHAFPFAQICYTVLKAIHRRTHNNEIRFFAQRRMCTQTRIRTRRRYREKRPVQGRMQRQSQGSRPH